MSADGTVLGHAYEKPTIPTYVLNRRLRTHLKIHRVKCTELDLRLKLESHAVVTCIMYHLYGFWFWHRFDVCAAVVVVWLRKPVKTKTCFEPRHLEITPVPSCTGLKSRPKHRQTPTKIPECRCSGALEQKAQNLHVLFLLHILWILDGWMDTYQAIVQKQSCHFIKSNSMFRRWSLN